MINLSLLLMHQCLVHFLIVLTEIERCNWQPTCERDVKDEGRFQGYANKDGMLLRGYGQSEVMTVPAFPSSQPACLWNFFFFCEEACLWNLQVNDTHNRLAGFHLNDTCCSVMLDSETNLFTN